jgi:dihydroflavonol-4-reductase
VGPCGGVVLVTGATGFIGGHLVERLLAEGSRVRCLVRPGSRRPAAARRLPPPEAESVLGDLESGAGLEYAMEGVTLVFHVAGVTKALRASGYYLGNVNATRNLARAVARTDARLVHLSSIAAAGPSHYGRPLDENSIPRPLTDYGKSKLETEQLLRAQIAERTTIIRAPLVYGPRDIDVLHMFQSAARGARIRIGDRERYFSYLYVSDLIDGLLLAAQPGAAGRTYFLASPEPATWTEFHNAAASMMLRTLRTLTLPVWAAYLAGILADSSSRLLGRPWILSRDRVRDARHYYWTCDPTRAAAELGFQAQTSLREGVAATIEWYRHAHWLNY